MERRGTVSEFAVFHLIDIRKRPSIFEGSTSGLASDRCSVVLVRVERRIKVDEIEAFAVHATHDVEVITDEDGFVFPIPHNQLLVS